LWIKRYVTVKCQVDVFLSGSHLPLLLRLRQLRQPLGLLLFLLLPLRCGLAVE